VGGVPADGNCAAEKRVAGWDDLPGVAVMDVALLLDDAAVVDTARVPSWTDQLGTRNTDRVVRWCCSVDMAAELEIGLDTFDVDEK
jgi:hypothetical protein